MGRLFLAITGSVILLVPSIHAGTINFEFDNGGFTANTSPVAPFVGSGTFTFSNDPGDGTNPLTSFGAYSFAFNFGTNTYTTGDELTTPSTVLVILSTVGGVRTLNFSNTSSSGDGPMGGSIDFENANGGLSFEPPGAGGDTLYIESSGEFMGTYGATGSFAAGSSAVPEPSTAVLLGFGLLAGVISHRRLTRRAQA